MNARYEERIKITKSITIIVQIPIKRELFINNVIAIVVQTVAAVVGATKLFGQLPASAAGVEDAFVDFAITIVVVSVADFSGLCAAATATVEHAFIHLAVAIVILSVAGFRARLDGASAFAPRALFADSVTGAAQAMR